MTKLMIENICNLVIAEGLAENEGDFCERWLCRAEGYMRTLRFRQLQPSVEALMTCADKLVITRRYLRQVIAVTRV